MSIYSTRFVEVVGPTALGYTVPAGHLAVVRCITVVNRGSGTGTADVALGNTGTYLASFKLGALDSAPPAVFSQIFDLRVVADVGDQILALPSADVHVTISGYLFSLE